MRDRGGCPHWRHWRAAASHNGSSKVSYRLDSNAHADPLGTRGAMGAILVRGSAGASGSTGLARLLQRIVSGWEGVQNWGAPGASRDFRCPAARPRPHLSARSRMRQLAQQSSASTSRADHVRWNVTETRRHRPEALSPRHLVRRLRSVEKGELKRPSSEAAAQPMGIRLTVTGSSRAKHRQSFRIHASAALRHLAQRIARAVPGVACAPRRKRRPRRKFPACGTSELQRQARGVGLPNGATRSFLASRILIDVADRATPRSPVGSLCLANMTVCRRTLRQCAAPRSTQGRTAGHNAAELPLRDCGGFASATRKVAAYAGFGQR